MNPFKTAWRHTIGHKFWLFIGTFVMGIGGSVAATFVTDDEISSKLEKIIVNIFFIIGGIVVAFVVIYLWHLTAAVYEWVHNRWVEAKCIMALKKANEYRANANSINIEGMHEDEFRDFIKKGCENLKDAFNDFTNSDCGVSIKVSVAETNSNWETWAFKNHCRASGRDGRETSAYENKKHLVRQNTAYIEVLNQLYENLPLGYINNDVKHSPDYHSSSTGCYDKKYDYNSECVYPIVPLGNRDEATNETYGFVCIDSYKTGVFSREMNGFDILVSYADMFYCLFKKRQKK